MKIKFTPYRDAAPQNAAWTWRIWLQTQEQKRHLGVAKREEDGRWTSAHLLPCGTSATTERRLLADLRAAINQQWGL